MKKTRRNSLTGAAVALMTLLSTHCAQAQLSVDAAMGSWSLMTGQKQKAYLRVALVGEETEGVKDRAPLNVAFVLDRSTSMTGEKLVKAKQAAIAAVDRLAATDVVSVVAYDDEVDVLYPARKMTEPAALHRVIRGLTPRGNTALYGGVKRAGEELQRFNDGTFLNRVVLLSDGLANRGPSSTEALAGLGRCLKCENTSVTTIGLGLDFNEDLMTALAAASDGNHMFAETAEDVLRAFSAEFDDALSVVAKNVSISIEFDPRIHPLRGMGREVSIQGQRVYAGLNQVYSEQTKYILIEVEVDPVPREETIQAASVQIGYARVAAGEVADKHINVPLAFTTSAEIAANSENRDVMECVIAQRAAEQNELALQQRDRGQVEASRQTLERSVRLTQENAKKYDSKMLEELSRTSQTQAGKIGDDKAWKGLRKSMSKGQYDIKRQTSK